MNLSSPIIYLITQGNLTLENYRRECPSTLQIIESAVRSEISMLQIREKNLSGRLLFDLVTKVVRLRGKSKTRILVNDRADIARSADADGVHLTSRSVRPDVIRRTFPGNFIIGVSAHSVGEVVKSKLAGADFVTFSPIGPTPEKLKYGPPQGFVRLAEAVGAVDGFPVIALGGINEQNLDEVFRTGARGIGAIRLLNDINNLPDLVKKIQKYYEER